MKKVISLLTALFVIVATLVCPAYADFDGTMSVAYAGNGVFTVTGTLPDADGNYKLIVANYNNDVLEKAKLYGITSTSFTQSVDFSDNVYETATFMLWDFNNMKPYASVVANPKAAIGTDVASGKAVAGTGVGGAWTGLMTGSSIVDGDEDTSGGFWGNFGTNGYMYIDLDDYYKVDRIEVLAYSNVSYLRAGEFDIVMSNDVPDANAYDSENPNGEYKVVAAGADKAATSKDVGYKTFYVPADAGTYRYVSFEKFGGESGQGLSIAEVKVYVKNENIPVYVNVASGKYASGSTSSTGNVALYGTDSTGYIATGVQAGNVAASRIVDGNPETGAGFMVGVNVNGNMYVDLGAAYKIDHIKVLSYCENENTVDRANNYTVVMSNSVRNGYTSPDANKYEFEPVTGVAACGAANATYKKFRAPNNDTKYRFVSVEKFTSGSAGLSIAEIEVYVRPENANETIPTYTEVANGKTTGGSQIDANGNVVGTLMYTSANLVDGNETNFAGFYYSVYKGHVYIDLGQKHKIDHIEVVASNPSRPACAGDYDVVVSNTAPTGTAYDSANPNGRLLVDHANYDSQMTSAANSVRRFYLPAGNNEYQYISFEKFQDNNMGMLLNEVKVYVKSDEVPAPIVPATNVALGKGANGIMSRGCLGGYDDLSVVTDGQLCVGGNSQQIIAYLGAWYCLDLGQSYDIEKVMVDAVADTYTSQVSVYLSNDPASATTGLPANKTTILDGTTNTAAWGSATKTVELTTPINARYVIVERPSGASGNNLRLGEIEVWGK